jgi:hypothetical protein
MQIIQHIGTLPKPIQYLAKQFIHSDPHDPVICEMTLEEIENLREEEEIMLQLIFDRTYDKWYLIAVGDYERTIASEIILHDPMRVKRSILAFCPVDESWIRTKRMEYEEKFIRQQPYEYDGDTNRWI